jgi:hypothetical protein
VECRRRNGGSARAFRAGLVDHFDVQIGGAERYIAAFSPSISTFARSEWHCAADHGLYSRNGFEQRGA